MPSPTAAPENARAAASHRLAIYDMDRTITVRATYPGFLLHAARRLAPWRLVLLPVAGLLSLAYLLRLLDRARLKELNQRLLLGPHLHPQQLAPVAESFAALTLARNIHPGAIAAIAADRAAGRRLVMATASYRLYVEAIAARLGFDDVIATNSLKGFGERIAPRIDGENCYGPAKLRMIQAWMSREGIARGEADICFYSDHASDACVMEWSDTPYAVNAHDRLRRIARAKGWAVLEWG